MKLFLNSIVSAAVLAGALTMPNPAHAALTDGLVARYIFDNSSYADASGNGFAASPIGNAQIVYEHGNQAVLLDGAGSYVTVPDASALTPSVITLSAWVKPEQMSFPMRIIEKGNWSYWMFISSGVLNFGINTPNGNTTIQSNGPLLDKEWNHVCGTYDGSQLRLYVNGVAQTATATLSGAIAKNTQALGIGANVNDTTTCFHGFIDDVRIWNRTLTPTEVASVYGEGIIAPTGITVTGVPGSDIYLNGHYTGKQTPATINVVNPGHYWVGIGNDAYGYQQNQAYVAAGKPATIGFDSASGWLPPRTWKILMVYIRNAVMDDVGGVPAVPLTDSEIQAAHDSMALTGQQWVGPYSRNLVQWQVTYVTNETVPGHLHLDTGFPSLDTNRYIQEAGLTNDYQNNYESIMFFYPDVRQDGQPYVTSIRAGTLDGVSAIPNIWESWGWQEGSGNSQIFLHEWMHVGEQYYRDSFGWDTGVEDGATSYGYTSDPNLVWLPFYKDYLRGKVPAGNNTYVGYSPLAWIEGSRLTKNILPRNLSLGAPTVLFSDDFEDGSLANWTQSGGAWSIATDGSKVLKQSSTSASNARAFAGSSTWANQTVTAQIKPLSFKGTDRFAALFARLKDTNNYYFVTLRSSGKIEIEKLVSGSVTVLASKSFIVSTNTWYKVQFSVIGSTLQLYVNDILQLSATDTKFAAGKVGVGTYYSTAEFDNLTVTQ
jgi:hypothetical protein